MDVHKQLSIKKSLSLHPKLQGVTIPKSNENELIIPCRLSYYGFILLNENQEHVKDIAANRINQTLMRLNKEIDLILIEKKQEESKDYQQSKIYALRSLFVTGIIIAFVMYMLVLYEVTEFKEKYIFIPLAVIIAILIISLIIMVKGLMTERVRINVDKEIDDIIDKVLHQENQLFYSSKGYVMEKSEKYFWLSLKKLY